MGQGEQAHAGGAGSRTKHGDPVRVPAESCNVLLHPAKGLDLIQQAIIPFCRLVTCAEKSCTDRDRVREKMGGGGAVGESERGDRERDERRRGGRGRESKSKIFCRKLTMQK